MAQKLSDKTIREINKFSQEFSNKQIAEELGISDDSVLKYREKTKKKLANNLKQDNYLEDINKKNAKNELNILKKKYGDVIQSLETQEQMYKVFNETKLKQGDTRIVKKKGEGDTQSTANLLFSDVHIEEVIDKDTINGLNEYNPEIARQRTDKMFIRFVEVVQSLKKSENIHGVILHLLGDFITGYIHPELVEGNAMSPTEAILLSKSTIIAGINYILANTDEDILVVTAFGNHGRTTDKKRVSTGRKNSYEWLMYNIIAQHYETNKRVKFKIEKGNLNYVNVYDKVMCDMHGDMIKYQGGVGGLTIPMNKAIAQRQKAKHADLYNSGHRHQLRDGGIWQTNGSIIGYGNYSEAIKADYEEPKQLMFLFNSKYGKTITSPIILT